MKFKFLKGALLTSLMVLSLSVTDAHAETTWSSKCNSFGIINPNQNPPYQQINCLLTNAAIAANIPPEVVKAVARKESDWKQFYDNGQPNISPDGGIGIMQITNQANYNQEELKTDIVANIQAGVEILKSKYNLPKLPNIKNAGRDVIENWYFPVMAYNGTVPSNSPLKKFEGTPNKIAYQEIVFDHIEEDSFVRDTDLANFPFSPDDFDYDSNTNTPISFKKLEYTLTDEMHASAYFFQKGDKVVVTKDSVQLRPEPSRNILGEYVSPSIPFIIDGDFSFDQTTNKNYQYVWYPVTTADHNYHGFISSAYLKKMVDTPSLNPVNDHDITLTGTAIPDAMVQFMSESTVADENGKFSFQINPQTAGTLLAVTYKNKLNAMSPPATLRVEDKTAPVIQKVDNVTNKSTIIKGKTEIGALVTVTLNNKPYRAAMNNDGTFSLPIAVQNAGTTFSIAAKDASGNVTNTKTLTVLRVAPNIPVVKTIITSKSTSISGFAEKGVKVNVVIGRKTISVKVDSKGNFKLAIQKQKAGTKITFTAIDKNHRMSVARILSVK